MPSKMFHCPSLLYSNVDNKIMTNMSTRSCWRSWRRDQERKWLPRHCRLHRYIWLVEASWGRRRSRKRWLFIALCTATTISWTTDKTMALHQSVVLACVVLIQYDYENGHPPLPLHWKIDCFLHHSSKLFTTLHALQNSSKLFTHSSPFLQTLYYSSYSFFSSKWAESEEEA